MEQKHILFEAKEITKHFGDTVALDHVSIQLFSGEIRGLIGENGSGKSTLSSIIAGMQRPTEGEMYFQGEKYEPATMLEGAALGVGMILQEAGRVAGISVAQNIFIGNEKRFRKNGVVQKKKMCEKAGEALAYIGISHISPDEQMDALSQQDQKLVEMAKIYYGEPKILIVDETTTALSQQGREILYRLIEHMKKEGKSVLFISHDLEELMSVCDSLTVLRDGRYITTVESGKATEHEIKQYMVGREIGEHYYRTDYGRRISDEVVLSIRELTCGYGPLKKFSLDLHRGELVGIGGLSHCGMHELGKAVFGDAPVIDGEVIHTKSGRRIQKPEEAVKAGIGYVSKDRDREALISEASIRENIVSVGCSRLKGKGGLIRPSREKKYVGDIVQSLRIKCSDMNQKVKSLSGGNKQKVAFGKWIGRESGILILDCPTRGIDIGVKASMYQLIDEMLLQGKSILMISEELTELIGMSDRILILKDGEVTGEFPRKETLTENELIEVMI